MRYSVEGWKGDAMLLQVQSAAPFLGPTHLRVCQLESCIALPWPTVSALTSLCFIWGSPSLLLPDRAETWPLSTLFYAAVSAWCLWCP